MWVGAYRTGPGNSFAWEDGSPWDYEFWTYGEPNNLGGSENHVVVHYSPDGSWNDDEAPEFYGCLFVDTVSK